MATDTSYDVLAADLVALGRSMPASVPSEELSVAVMTRLSDLPAPVAESRHRRLLRRASETIGRHRRRAVVAVTAIMLALLVTPPVRAAVADWFGFAGVSVRIDPTPAPSVASPPPALGSTLSLDQARDLVAFEPLIPAELGQPQGVQVAADHRLLSMSWTDKSAGPVRLDQFDGQLDFVFAKTAPGVEFTEVNGDFAIWFDQPHEVVVLNADGTRRTETARLAGHTLIWEYGGSALRLEGDLPLSRAIEIADSVAPVR